MLQRVCIQQCSISSRKLRTGAVSWLRVCSLLNVVPDDDYSIVNSTEFCVALSNTHSWFRIEDRGTCHSHTTTMLGKTLPGRIQLPTYLLDLNKYNTNKNSHVLRPVNNQ